MTAPTPIVTLADWLLERIAEDEALAEAATPGPWVVEYGRALRSASIPDDEEGGTTYFSIADKPDAAHIARHDPARVLAECAAKRRIISFYGDNLDAELIERQCVLGDKGPHVAWLTLRALAAPYAGHEGWRAEWGA